MSDRVEAIVNPELLRWARESLGLDIEAAAKKVNVKPAQLQSWERDEKRPTIKQLRKLANVYKRPLAVFYLPAPPRTFDALRDFRRLPGEVAGKESPGLRLQVRRAQNRRQLALDLYELLEGTPPNFEVSATISSNPERLGNQIRSLLGISYPEQTSWQYDYEAFNRWRSALEEKGVLVFQLTDVAVGEIRGFSISEIPLPVIAVNIKDSPRSRIFTMAHELAHIILRQGGLCDLEEEQSRLPDEQRIEIFCNHVAGAALVPQETLLSEDIVQPRREPTSWLDDEIETLARKYRASRETVLRRLLILGRTTEEFYRRKREEYRQEYESLAAQETEGFVPPYRMAISSAGRMFARLVLEGYNRERITASDLSDYLNIRLKHLPRIQRELLGAGGAVRG